MATSQALQVLSKPASADLSASQYCAVVLDTNGRLILPTAGGAVLGVLQNDDAKAIDQECTVAISGESKMKLGGTVTTADVVKCDSSGRAVTASAADVLAGNAFGVCSKGGGINNIGSVVILDSALGVGSISGEETVTTGALSSLVEVSYLSVTGTQAFTLPIPKYPGQRRRVECSVAATVPLGTLTITAPFTADQATYVFDTVGQAIELIGRQVSAGVFGWHIVNKRTAGKGAFVMGTNNIAAGDLHSQCDFTVTGTVSSSIGAGQVDGEMKHVTVSAASGTPHGSVTGAFATKIGAASATWGSGTDITSTASYLWVRWSAGDAKWHEVVSATALFA